MNTSRFFALLNRLNLIKRWGLMRNTQQENVMEHSWQVATISHALAIIRTEVFGQKDVSPDRVAAIALYHDCSEIITGDLPTPVKYHSNRIAEAYKAIEAEAEHELVSQLPEALQDSFIPYLISTKLDQPSARLVKSADLISAYLKCQFEQNAGNTEFSEAAKDIERKIRELQSDEVEYFMSHFVSSYQLTLDELLAQHKP